MPRYSMQIVNDTLEYIKEYQRENGKSPTYRDIMKKYPHYYTTLSKVDRYLEILIEKGLISKSSDGRITVADIFVAAPTKQVSLIGNCACGQPMFAEENIEATYAIPESWLGYGEFFMLRAKGMSMRDVGISDNDRMIVRKQDTAENGQIVIAMVDGGEATAKRFYLESQSIRLHPENSDVVDGEKVYSDIVVNDCKILGIVVSVWHDVK